MISNSFTNNKDDDQSYEEYDTTGERRVRVETHTKVFFDNDDTRHNPTKTYTVEYL